MASAICGQIWIISVSAPMASFLVSMWSSDHLFNGTKDRTTANSLEVTSIHRHALFLAPHAYHYPHRCHTNCALTLKCMARIWTSGRPSVDWLWIKITVFGTLILLAHPQPSQQFHQLISLDSPEGMRVVTSTMMRNLQVILHLNSLLSQLDARRYVTLHGKTNYIVHITFFSLRPPLPTTTFELLLLQFWSL